MMVYAVTIDGDTEIYQAESFTDAIDAAFDAILEAHFHEDDLAADDFLEANVEEIQSLRRHMNTEGLESVYWVGDIVNHPDE